MGIAGIRNVKKVVFSEYHNLILNFASNGIGDPHVKERWGKEFLGEMLHELDFEVLDKHGKGENVDFLE